MIHYSISKPIWSYFNTVLHWVMRNAFFHHNIPASHKLCNSVNTLWEKVKQSLTLPAIEQSILLWKGKLLCMFFFFNSVAGVHMYDIC